MGDYGELVELGFEGVDRATEKYHDKVYDHLPAWKKKLQRQQRRQDRAQNLQASSQQQQDDQASAANEDQRSRKDSAADRNGGAYSDDRGMPSHAPDRRRDYREDRDARADGAYQPRIPSPPPIYAPSDYGHEYDARRDYSDRGRPAPSRMRSTSWSPPRNQRHKADDSRRRRRSRSRSRPRPGSKGGSSKHRIAAALIGGLMGGIAGNQFGKGQKYDTAATVGGAVLGGIAARQATELMGGKKEERKEKREEEQQAWEQKFGDKDGGGDGRRSRDGRDDGDSRRY